MPIPIDSVPTTVNRMSTPVPNASDPTSRINSLSTIADSAMGTCSNLEPTMAVYQGFTDSQIDRYRSHKSAFPGPGVHLNSYFGIRDQKIKFIKNYGCGFVHDRIFTAFKFNEVMQDWFDNAGHKYVDYWRPIDQADTGAKEEGEHLFLDLQDDGDLIHYEMFNPTWFRDRHE